MEYKISLRAARVNADMTQKAAAEAISVDPATIANWEKGFRSPKAEQLYKLCEVYRVPIDYIFLRS